MIRGLCTEYNVSAKRQIFKLTAFLKMAKARWDFVGFLQSPDLPTFVLRPSDYGG